MSTVLAPEVFALETNKSNVALAGPLKSEELKPNGTLVLEVVPTATVVDTPVVIVVILTSPE